MFLDAPRDLAQLRLAPDPPPRARRIAAAAEDLNIIWHIVKEKRNRHIENFPKLEKPARPNAVRASLIFLNLLKSKINHFA
jgi:hypothetical protein